MLDQNTDRMWYVIGAIVIGAAIIAMGLNIYNESFMSVEDNFSNVIGAVDTNLKWTSNLVSDSDFVGIGASIESYDRRKGEWVLDIPPVTHSWGRGLVADREVLVPYGKTLTISYEVYVPEDLDNIGTRNDINNYIEGTPRRGSNDNDELSRRRFNGMALEPDMGTGRLIPLDSGAWNKVWFSYSNTNDTTNPDKESFYDRSYIGVWNNTDSNIKVNVRNVHYSLSDS